MVGKLFDSNGIEFILVSEMQFHVSDPKSENVVNERFTVLVNSCDSFEDTWLPFFKLYSEFGSELRSPITLVTENREFSFGGLPITCSISNRGKPARLGWAECLHQTLQELDSELILYFQDDYFIERPIEVGRVNAIADEMLKHPEVGYIALTHIATPGPFSKIKGSHASGLRALTELGVVEIDQKAPYRVSLQASLWRKSTMLSLLNVDENGWMFEIFGTQRAKRRTALFLSVSRESSAPIFYEHTGIIKGKWNIKMPALFESHGIEIDFSKRGFYQAPPTILRKFETFRMLMKRPEKLVSGLLGR